MTCESQAATTASPILQKGLSLVEVMVAMVIGLVLVVGATTVYVNSRKSSDVDEAIARLQETARYALSVIESDVRMANFWGLAKGGSAVANKPGQSGVSTSATDLVDGTDAEDCGATFAIDTERYVDGSNNAYATTEAGCQPRTGAIASADTLTVRRAAIEAAAVDNSRLQICANRLHVEIIKGGTCSAPNTAYSLVTNLFYIDGESDHNNSVPSLRRKSLTAGPAFRDVEIIPGVEDMQVQFGWESTDVPAEIDSTAERYLNPGHADLDPTKGQIVAVRVWLLIRAENPDRQYRDTQVYEYGDRAAANGTTNNINAASAATLAYRPNDNFRRLLVSRTIYIRNVVGS